MKHVEYTLRDGVAVLAFANPPVNSLSHALRQELVESLDRAVADAAARAIVLIGSNGTFSGGADIKEFGTPAMLKAPSLLHVIAAFEDSTKPVVAAIAGLALGGGLELALGCHYRVAHQDAKIGLPEVKLGLLPGAGGTQRLPRAARRGDRAQHDRRRRAGPERRCSRRPARAVRPARRRRPARGGGRLRAPRSADEPVRCRGCATATVREPDARGACAVRAQHRQGGMARTSRRRSHCVDAVAARPRCRSTRAWPRSAALHAPVHRPESRRCATSSSPSAPPRRSPTCRRARRCAPSKSAAVDRRRHHGRRHRDELPQRRHPGDACSKTKQEALDKRRRHASARTTRRQVKKGKLTQDKLDAAHGAAHADARLRRPRATPTS